jgi:hypothetical protein
MAANGLRLQRRANGLVITARDGTTVKASSVGREFSKNKLEERLGPFQSGPEQDAGLQTGRSYERNPLYFPQDASALQARYQAEQTRLASIRAAEGERIRERKERQIKAATRSVRLKRAALKLVVMPRAAKKAMYGALAKALRDEIAEVKRECELEYKVVGQAFRQLRWVDWLRQQAGSGQPDALALLRWRKPTRDLVRGGVSGTACTHPPFPTHRCDSVTRQGTVIFRFGASAIRDEGEALRVSTGADQVAVQAALRIAIERFGSIITVRGSDSFKEKIVIAAAAGDIPVAFSDRALEHRRVMLAHSATAQENHIKGGGAPRADIDHKQRPVAVHAQNVQARYSTSPRASRTRKGSHGRR